MQGFYQVKRNARSVNPAVAQQHSDQEQVASWLHNAGRINTGQHHASTSALVC